MAEIHTGQVLKRVSPILNLDVLADESRAMRLVKAVPDDKHLAAVLRLARARSTEPYSLIVTLG
jgi:hypothetical protein